MSRAIWRGVSGQEHRLPAHFRRSWPRIGPENTLGECRFHEENAGGKSCLHSSEGGLSVIKAGKTCPRPVQNWPALSRFGQRCPSLASFGQVCFSTSIWLCLSCCGLGVWSKNSLTFCAYEQPVGGFRSAVQRPLSEQYDGWSMRIRHGARDSLRLVRGLRWDKVSRAMVGLRKLDQTPSRMGRRMPVTTRVSRCRRGRGREGSA
jgi:hypothetical protein